MGLLGWIILGGLAGWLAAVLLEERRGCALNILVGIVGAVLGGLVFNALGSRGVTGFNLWSLAVAILGSLALLTILRLLRGGGGGQRRR
jgi:uncharacterized membrane protein YeaQ/YmgE (transglycosylase-associated protein family)